MQIETSPLSSLSSFEDNPRRISSEALLRLKTSIRTLGLFKPLLGWRRSPGDPLVVIGGNQRLRAIREMVGAGEIEESPIPVVVYAGDEVSARTIALRDNASEGEWEWGSLASYVTDLEALARDAEIGLDLTLTGFDAKTLDGLAALAEKQRDAIATLFGEGQDEGEPGGAGALGDKASTAPGAGGEEEEPILEGRPLAERFLFAPFSVLDQRRGEWVERKRLWETLFDSARGRGTEGPVVVESGVGIKADAGILLVSVSGRDPQFYKQKREVERGLGRRISKDEFERFHYKPPEGATGITATGTSVFDPVLAEIVYRWWGLPGGSVLDPFAGGSVRGIVCSALRQRYTGVDLRPEQVAENREQWARVESVLPGGRPAPRWVEGDSSALDRVLPPEQRFDLVFSCPPYYDLEVYSDDERDLSTLSWGDFLAGYRAAIRSSVERLADNRFAVFVVGEIRDPGGRYRNFVGETVRAFLDAGMSLYNEAILVSPTGSVAVRIPRAFGPYRKLGKVHQNVLVFYKGDVKRIPEDFGVLDMQGRTGILDEQAPTSGAAEPASPASSAPEAAPQRRTRSRKASAPTAPTGPDAPAPAPVAPAPPEAGQVAGEPVEAVAAPAWARGYDLARLREIASLFKRHDEGLVLGAFGAAKETAIAAWLAEDRLTVIERDGRVVAAAVATTVERRKVGKDWQDDARFEIGAGALHVTRLAFSDDDAETRLVERVESLASGRDLWVEAWAEHEGEQRVVARLRASFQGSKISAASEIRSVSRRLSSGLPAGLRDYSAVELAHLTPLTPLGLPVFDPAPLLRAVEERVSGWADHYSSYNKRNSWTALALRSFGGDPSFIIKPAEMAKAWKEANPEKLSWGVEDTPLRALLPEAEDLLRLLPGRHERVRLMRLAPGGGELSRHADITDPDAGIREGRLARIHLPLVSNPDVVFEGWLPDGRFVRRHMQVGQVWYLDTRKPHRAVNGGTTDRIHLVVDAVVDRPLLRLIEAGANGGEL